MLSASSAEIVSGAIQDLDRGVLIGQRSFGKGLVQSTAYIGFGNYVKLTTAKYHIPSGRCIQAVRYTADGRAQSMPDSLVGEFSTARGRKVYDGGGIKPDIAPEPKYVSNFAVALYLSGAIDDFGDDYMRRHHADTIDNGTFSITDADYEGFARLVAERDIPYKSESRRALDALRTALDKERLGESMGDALKDIDSRLHDDKISNLRTYRKEIEDYINSNIVLRFSYAAGEIENSLTDDADVQQAIAVLRDKERYESITAGQPIADGQRQAD